MCYYLHFSAVQHSELSLKYWLSIMATNKEYYAIKDANSLQHKWGL